MSTYYGRLQGSRGEATRCGTAASGISVTAETWGSILRAEQHSSTVTDSGHEATVSVRGKYGGAALTLRFDADTLYAQSDVPAVRDALDAVKAAMRAADEAAQEAAKAERVARKAQAVA